MLLIEIFNKQVELTDELIEQAVQMIRPIFYDQGESVAVEAIENIYGREFVEPIIAIIKQTMRAEDKPTLGNELLAQYNSSGQVVPPEVVSW